MEQLQKHPDRVFLKNGVVIYPLPKNANQDCSDSVIIETIKKT